MSKEEQPNESNRPIIPTDINEVLYQRNPIDLKSYVGMTVNCERPEGPLCENFNLGSEITLEAPNTVIFRDFIFIKKRNVVRLMGDIVFGS